MPNATAGQVGEFGLIAQITDRLGTTPGVLLGPGDDAALLACPDGRVVATTDVLVQDVHFRLDWSSARDVGHKAAAANLADVAAMGATATGLLVGLAIPASLPVEWATGLADGLRDEAAGVGAAVVGGDVVTCDRIVVSVTALGDLAGLAPVTRSGARPGDQLVLAGTLGGSAAGLSLLLAGAAARHPALVAAHRRPRPPYTAGPALARAGASAMCDVSDGLLADLLHVAEASGVRVHIEAAAVPMAAGLREAAAELGVHPLDLALTGGEDHALVATLPAGAPLPPQVVRIGSVLPGTGIGVTGHRVRTAGWQHFAEGGDS